MLDGERQVRCRATPQAVPMGAAMTHLFEVGDIVESVQVGGREKFVGTISELLTTYRRDSYYHVKDDDGVEWHREEAQLKLMCKAKCAEMHNG